MSARPKNILFIMTDQFRADCLGCAGHPVLKTPNLDSLAGNGVRFTRCYSPSAVCVPARASLSTGRYVQSHRTWWNETPWPSDEKLMGDYLREAGVQSYQCGKSHYRPDDFTGVADPPMSERFVGLFSMPFPDMKTVEFNDGWCYNYDYRDYLRQAGYGPEFIDYPHQMLRPDGTLEPWTWRSTHLPCALKTHDTDTAFTARRAIEFLDEEHDSPWMLFLSWYRPHQPYSPSGRYYRMYQPEDVPSPVRSEAEWDNPHIIWRKQAEMWAELTRDEQHWRWVRSGYYGLIAELDDWTGAVMRKLEERGLQDDTLIIFTSDHGDYLGDHWLYEKESFYDQANRVPLIVVDPSPEADATRGTTCGAWTQLVDLLPTMLDWHGSEIGRDIEGWSILPFVRGRRPDSWRTEVFAVWDYHNYFDPWPEDKRVCGRGVNVRDERYNFWHFPGLDDVLFDLEKDPEEFTNVAQRKDYSAVVAEHRSWALRHLLRYTDSRRTDWRTAEAKRMKG